ncbi:MAG: 50S ribosomal protein L15 [Dehalococcoidia bacterium]|nr:50S ribosomal protein L15 [Dehalococcoidia bacterium]
MDQHTLKQPAGAKRARKRVGRGVGSGTGRNAARGVKGQKKRGSVPPGFEGGQISVVRRAPRLRGFKNFGRVEFLAINLETLSDRFPAGATVDGDSLVAAGLLEAPNQPYKILARGELAHALNVTAPRISATAREAITQAGGTVEETAAADRTPRNRVHRRKAEGK